MTAVKHPVFNGDQGLKTTGATREGKAIQFYHVPSNYSIDFKAFVTEFSDEFSSNWESEDIYGRMDPIRTFASTQRRITLAFDVVAANAEEARHNLKQMTMLANFHYPSYDEGIASTTAINQSPLLRVKYMNWICQAHNPEGSVETSGLLCASDGFTYAPDVSDLTYELNGLLYPKIVNVSLTLNFPYNSAHVTQQEIDAQRNDVDVNAVSGAPVMMPDQFGLADIQNDLTMTDEERQAAINKRLGIDDTGPTR
jgi:hypothetical protein